MSETIVVLADGTIVINGIVCEDTRPGPNNEMALSAYIDRLTGTYS